MTNEIIEAVVFLIPGFLFFECFRKFSVIETELSDRQYYLICLFLSFSIHTAYFFHLGIASVQELGSNLFEIETIFKLFLICILLGIFSGFVGRYVIYPHHKPISQDVWNTSLKKQSKDGAPYVTVITSDSSEFEGKLLWFSHRKHEPRELVLEEPTQIIRDKDMKAVSEIKRGTEILFTQGDIKRITFNDDTRK